VNGRRPVGVAESALGLVALAGCLLARIIVVVRVQLASRVTEQEGGVMSKLV